MQLKSKVCCLITACSLFFSLFSIDVFAKTDKNQEDPETVQWKERESYAENFTDTEQPSATLALRTECFTGFTGKISVTIQKENGASSESAYETWERGTSTCLWVLLDLMDQKKIEQHFLASKEEYPIRIVFVGDGEIFDILYVAPEDIELTNQLFVRRKIDGCGHVVVVEEAESIPKIQVSDVIGYCTVKEDGEVEYYRKESR